MPSDPCVISGSPVKESILANTNNRHFDISSQQIGRGTYSTVFLGRDLRNDEPVAVKSMDLRRYENEFDSEVAILSLIDHDGVVKLRSSEIVRDTGYLFMELIQSPTLFDYVRRSRGGHLPEDQALKIFLNIIEAVEAVHLKGWAHRDLKPENLMVNPETLEVKLIDFGLSVPVPPKGLNENFCGSPMYMSPEVLNRERHDPRVADVWSLGVILYHMLVGDSPWSQAESLDELLDLVVFEPVVRLPSFLSDMMKEILSGMFNHDTKKRLSLQQIKPMLLSLLSDC